MGRRDLFIDEDQQSGNKEKRDNRPSLFEDDDILWLRILNIRGSKESGELLANRAADLCERL